MDLSRLSQLSIAACLKINDFAREVLVSGLTEQQHLGGLSHVDAEVLSEAAEVVVFDFEPLPAAVGTSKTLENDAPKVWPEFGTNVVVHWEYGDQSVVESKLATAAHRVSVDIVNNRTKRLFDDRTGARCGSNTKPFLLQTYKRDTGEVMHDLSAPIHVDGKHWGGFRVGYRSSGQA